MAKPKIYEKREHCGCYAINRDEGKPFTIFFCPKHAAAGKLKVALETLLERYVKLADSGDCGFWDPEEEIEVIAARAALQHAAPDIEKASKR